MAEAMQVDREPERLAGASAHSVIDAPVVHRPVDDRQIGSRVARTCSRRLASHNSGRAAMVQFPGGFIAEIHSDNAK